MRIVHSRHISRHVTLVCATIHSAFTMSQVFVTHSVSLILTTPRLSIQPSSLSVADSGHHRAVPPFWQLLDAAESAELEMTQLSAATHRPNQCPRQAKNKNAAASGVFPRHLRCNRDK